MYCLMQKVLIPVVFRVGSSEDCEEESIPSLLLSLWWCAGNLWQFFCLWKHHPDFFLYSHLTFTSVCLQIFSFYKYNGHIVLGLALMTSF